MSGSSYDHLWQNIDQLGERYDAVVAMRDRLAELGYEDAAADTNRALAHLDAAKAQADALVKVWEAVEKFASPAYHYEPSGRVEEAIREYGEKRAETQQSKVWVVATDYVNDELLGIHASKSGAEQQRDKTNMAVPVDVSEWTVAP